MVYSFAHQSFSIDTIIITYIIFENDFIDIDWLLKNLKETSSNDWKAIHYQLTRSSLRTIIRSMDTEYDRNTFKGSPVCN